jgi:hypothetical protein
MPKNQTVKVYKGRGIKFRAFSSGGMKLASCFDLQKEPLVSIRWDPGWVPEPSFTWRQREDPNAPATNRNLWSSTQPHTCLINHGSHTGTWGMAPTRSWPRRQMGWVVSVMLQPRFTRREEPPAPWVGPRAGLDAEVRRKVSAPVVDRTPVVQSVVRHYTDWVTLLRPY